MSTTTIARFYDYSETLRNKKVTASIANHSIHYGLWDTSTQSREEALINTNEVLSKLAGIRSGDRILDAGCGLGGSSVWLAKRHKTSVVGISLSQREIESAKVLADKYDVTTLAHFEVMDYANTSFSNASFEVVWAVESSIYAPNKANFVKESYRLLKRGGRLVLADVFVARELQDTKDTENFNVFTNGMLVPNIISISSFSQELSNAGFISVSISDYTDQVLPTVRQSYKLTKISYPFTWLSNLLGLTEPILKLNMKAGLSQKYLFESGLFKYYLLSCVKK